MKKSLPFLLLFVILSISCQNKSQKPEQEYDTEGVEMIFEQFKSLYNELLQFKNSPDFIRYGFGEGGPYHKWLKEVQTLKNNPDSKLLLKKGFVIGELEQLGMEYVSSKGQETDVTKIFNDIFSGAISQQNEAKSTDGVESTQENIEYNELKASYNQFGRWRISPVSVNESYSYEIYHKGNEYFGVIIGGNFRVEALEKKGDNYYIKGSITGDYYQIDGDMNMVLYDQNGDLSDMYDVTK